MSSEKSKTSVSYQGKADVEFPRFVTMLHFSMPVASATYQVVAYLDDGSERLVCLGSSREEAVTSAINAAKSFLGRIEAVRLARWVESLGGWRDVPQRRGEFAAFWQAVNQARGRRRPRMSRNGT